MKYIAHVTLPAPLIGCRRVEVDALSVDFARAKALRVVGVKGATVTVRPADTGTFDPSSVDSGFALFGQLPAVRC